MVTSCLRAANYINNRCAETAVDREDMVPDAIVYYMPLSLFSPTISAAD